MASYRVLIKPSAAKEIEAVDQKKDRQRIVASIRALGEEARPIGSEKLAGQTIATGSELVAVELSTQSPTATWLFGVRVADRRDVYL